MARRFLCWVGALAATGALGCRPRQDAAPSEPTPAVAAPEAPARRARRGPSAAVAAATSPVQLLPDTTAVVFTAAGVQALLAIVDVDGLIARYRATYDQAAAEVARVAGVNLLDPAQWAGVGLDAGGPMGAAMVDLRSETIVGFVSLADREVFRGFLERTSKGSLAPVLEDRGLVLKTDPDATSAVVLRDGFAFFVSTGRPSRAAYDHARALATLDPARGLTGTPRWQRAIGAAPTRPLTAYVDVWGLLAAEFAATTPREREPSWAEQELERAQLAGAPQEELRRLRLQADEERRLEEQRRVREQVKVDVATRWFEPVEPLVFEFTASQAGVTGLVRARMPETAPWRAAVRGGEPSPVFAALGERPVLLVGGSLDVAAARALLIDMIRLDGDDPDKELAAFKADTAIDLEQDLLPILTGSGGFALTVSDALLRGEARKRDLEVGFVAALGVGDPARARALVERAAAKVRGASLGKDRKTGATTLAIAGWRTVHATVAAGHIVVTTDPGAIARLTTGSQAGLGKHLAPAAVPVVTARGAAGQLMFDLMYPISTFVGRRGVSHELAPEEPYALFPDFPRAKIDAVPKSRAYKAKLREWQATDAKIRREEEAEERRQTKAALAVAEALGVQAWNLRETPDGLVVEGGHFFGKGGLGRAIDQIADSMGQGQRSEQVWELYGKRSGLDEELRRIRVTEVAAALRVPAPLPAP